MARKLLTPVNISMANVVDGDTFELLMDVDHPILGPKRDLLSIVIPLTTIYVIIFITGIIGNVSTCLVISRNKSMHTATNYYLCSLAVSDLVLLISGLPQEIIYLWWRYPYLFSENFCIARGIAAETSANATVLIITAFTVERYIAICHPFLTHTMSKLSRAVKIIFGIWLVSMVTAVPQALQFGLVTVAPKAFPVVLCVQKTEIIRHSFALSTILFFFAPMSLITVLYILIGMKLRSSTMVKKESCASWVSGTMPDGVGSSAGRPHGQSSRRVIKMLVAVVVAFFVCWAPFHMQRLIAIYANALFSLSNAPATNATTASQNHNDLLRVYEIVTYASAVLYYLSTTVNPLVYHLMSNKFRNAFTETFAAFCCGSKPAKRLVNYSSLSQHIGSLRNDPGESSGNSSLPSTRCNSYTRQQSFCSHPRSSIPRNSSASMMSNSSSSIVDSQNRRKIAVVYNGMNNKERLDSMAQDRLKLNNAGDLNETSETKNSRPPRVAAMLKWVFFTGTKEEVKPDLNDGLELISS